MSTTPARSMGFVSRWLTAPEPNAAGNAGLFRILFVLFYFWSLHDYHPEMLYGMPERFREMVLVNGWWFFDPPLWFFKLLGSVLVGALVLLGLGLWTRAATAVVLVAGALIEAYFTSLDLESASVFLKVFIPLFMLIGGDWGATYSVDAQRCRRAGQLRIAPSDTSERFVLPTRAVLVVLSAMFFTGAVWKCLPSSPWFVQDNVFGNLMTTRRIWAAREGLMMNPAAELFVQHSHLEMAMRVFVVLFEGLFFLALFNRRLRSFFVAMALIFHSINALWVYVTFSPILVVYGLFVDWESLRQKTSAALPGIGQALKRIGDCLAPGLLIMGGVLLAVAAALIWDRTRWIHAAASLGGWATWYTIWYPVLPLASAWWCWSTFQLGRGLLSRRAGVVLETKRR